MSGMQIRSSVPKYSVGDKIETTLSVVTKGYEWKKGTKLEIIDIVYSSRSFKYRVKYGDTVAEYTEADLTFICETEESFISEENSKSNSSDIIQTIILLFIIVIVIGLSQG